MHRLFAIDYLVNEICSHVRERSELAVLARVSSTWFRPAVSRLYQDIRLNRALAPLGKIVEKDEVLEFVNSPNDENLERLLKYTPYVRDIYFLSLPRDKSIALEAIRKSVSKGIPYLFPNLRSLTWNDIDDSPECIEVAMGLISPKINQLTLFMANDRMLYYFCPLIMTRLSTLSSLCIVWDYLSRDEYPTEPSLVEPLHGLLQVFARTLTSVHISSSFNTPLVAECLSKMPNLCDLTIGAESTWTPKKSGICGYGESFSSLCSFSYDGVFQSFYPIFVTPVASLASLTVLSLDTITPADVGIFISFIVSAFPNIRALSLGERNLIYTDPSIWPVVPWYSIQPISRCKQLSDLTLDWMRISASIEELTELLKSRKTWTCLDILTLNPLRLQDMLLYAQYCPNLKHFAIHLNRVGLNIEEIPSNIPTFSSVGSINFAYSDHDISRSESRRFAEFLYRICNKRLVSVRRLDDGDFKDYINESFTHLHTEEEC